MATATRHASGLLRAGDIPCAWVECQLCINIDDRHLHSNSSKDQARCRMSKRARGYCKATSFPAQHSMTPPLHIHASAGHGVNAVHAMKLCRTQLTVVPMICRLIAFGVASTLSKAKLNRFDSTRMRSAPRQKKKGRSNTALRAARHDMQVGKSDT